MDKLSITYFFRHPDAGFSIGKVFIPVVRHFRETAQVDTCTMTKHDASLKGILRNILHTRRHRNRHDINHITGDIEYITLGLLGCKSVLTVHDTTYADSMANPVKRLFFRWMYTIIPLLCAKRVTCISHKTRLSLQRFTWRKDIVVIPDAVDTTIFHHSPKDFQSEYPTLLIIGTAWNKNVPRQIRALKGIHCRLHIVGRLNEDIHNALQETGVEYRQFQNLSDEEIFQQYQDADILLFCTLAEGFGMPVVEAQTVGRPVVSSRIQPIIDVAGKGACLVNPNSETEIHNAVLRVINDAEYRQQLTADGLANARRYTPEIVNQMYEQVYRSLLS
ncbi:MAG: glycosyltransferase [Bacteroidaceae bacterium]|nr:glycosyltransferase [Bacteroidaceae bacterium]